MDTKHTSLNELSVEDIRKIRGGDYWDSMMGFMVANAFFAGALAAPPLLAVAAATGASLLIIDSF